MTSTRPAISHLPADALAQAARSGGDCRELLSLPVPKTYAAVHLRRDDEDWARAASKVDVRQTLHVGEVPMPALAPDEVLIAVMAAGVNYNTVWSAMYRPMSTFQFLRALGKADPQWGSRHDLPSHVVGSDASGIVVRVGELVTRWLPGDAVVVHPVVVDPNQPSTHADGMMNDDQRAWGFETNFGSFGHYTLVKQHQLLPKPGHLTWEEAAVNTLCATTSYRMLVSSRGAQMKQGDIVLIWGATGGLGAYAVQLVKGGGGLAVGVVSGPEKAALARQLGCDLVIDRKELPVDAQASAREMGALIRGAFGEDAHIVFEHVGAETFETSVFLARRGGTIVTCGSSSGYKHTYDNRYLWMRLKRIVGSHAANYQEAHETNRLFGLGMLQTTLSDRFALEDAASAVLRVQRNAHVGKLALMVLAEAPGQGVTDPELRDTAPKGIREAFASAASLTPSIG